jgi:hypothetical protein
MKSLQIIYSVFARVAVVFTLCLAQTLLVAQDKGLDIDVDVNKGHDNWYANPWVWAVGIAIFILLLVALLRNNKSA